MAKITLKGNPCHTCGELLSAGGTAPDFKLTRSDLSDVTLADFTGKKIILNIFPSIDTPVCAASVKKFNEQAASRSDTIVLCISKDLPFAQKRFCGTEGLEKVLPLSAFRSPQFGKDYGVEIIDGPLAGLFARAIVVIDPGGKVTHTELVNEIGKEPNYEKALA